MEQIVIRKDLRGNPFVFFVDTFNRKDGKIQMWDGVHGHQKEEVSVDFYKVTKPLDNEKKTEELVKGVTSNFGLRELVLRQRLVKESVGRNAEGKADMVDVDAYKKRLLAAVQKAIMETL